MDRCPRVRGVRRLEFQAALIDDPVRRLRFLRSATKASDVGDGPASNRGLRALLVAVVMIPLLIDRNPAVLSAEPRTSAIFPRVSNYDPPTVWLVERGAEHEMYSNGLRIENAFLAATHKRSYQIFDREYPNRIAARTKTDPAGIVFHTSESMQLEFEEGRNGALQRIGESLLGYVRARRSYNFLIDRFGRTFRIVPETDVANHAGHSIWADAKYIYLNLNSSFIGVSFEAETQVGEQPAVNPAQIHAGRMLAAMLRSQYGIAVENCVTHAQVSVNPANMRIGYHTDWAANFPFAAMGLPDNYALALPSIATFGFTYDATFLRSTGRSLWRGLAAGEELLRQSAAARGVPAAEYRKALQRQYQEKISALRRLGVQEETSNEAN
ncbi:MAG: N-acetylmuramoyl-L-alanine amidase [Bryobacteraceae bacterium]|nr:peptidoglycan recognition family protein [Bryobacterales bacterium]NUN01136.1 N-acetylmuramoyl-L-alanine amidase [Bryobacteraceae bacterium]